jgi:hypothetical protein
MPSLILRETRVDYGNASWDGVSRRMRMLNAPARGVGRDRSTLAEAIAFGERFGLGRGVAGWALGTLDDFFIAVRASMGQDSDRSTLFHEYTHVLLRRGRRAPLPRWYDEGLATYFSTLAEGGRR